MLYLGPFVLLPPKFFFKWVGFPSFWLDEGYSRYASYTLKQISIRFYSNWVKLLIAKLWNVFVICTLLWESKIYTWQMYFDRMPIPPDGIRGYKNMVFFFFCWHNTSKKGCPWFFGTNLIHNLLLCWR